LQTDLFLWANVVHEAMTHHWSGEGQGLFWDKKQLMVSIQEWLRLETADLGDLARKRRTGDITSATELLNAVRSAIMDPGVLIKDNDEIFDLHLEGMTTSGVRSGFVGVTVSSIKCYDYSRSRLAED
jgi:hypothetical protein